MEKKVKVVLIFVVIVLIAYLPAVVMFGSAGISTVRTVGCLVVKKIQNPLFDEHSTNPSNEHNRYSYYGTRFRQIIERHSGGLDMTECSILWRADYETFEVLDRVWAKDKNRAYYNLAHSVKPRVISFEVDGDTFELIDGKLAKDKNNIYCVDSVVGGVDAATFQLLGSNYFKDKDNVYYGICGDKIIIKEADPETFSVLRYDYAKDGNSVYYKADIVSNADALTFQVLDSIRQSVDEKGVYFNAYDKNRLFYKKEGFSVRSIDREDSDIEQLESEGAIDNLSLNAVDDTEKKENAVSDNKVGWKKSSNQQLGIEFKCPVSAKISTVERRGTVDGTTINELVITPEGADPTKVHFFTTSAPIEKAKNIQIYGFGNFEKSEFTEILINGYKGVRRVDHYSYNDCINEFTVFEKENIVYGSQIIQCPTHPEGYDQLRKDIANSLELL